MTKQKTILTYHVLVGCQNDKTGKRFEPGSTCTGLDFPMEVIDVWVAQGVLKPGEPLEQDQEAQ